MAEIKSTLDLVMEKTKNLSLSSEEKKAQKDKEIEARIRGLLQRFQDQQITLERFKADYQILVKDYNLNEKQIQHLIKAVCDQIELGKDNHVLIEILSEFAIADYKGLTTVLQGFGNRIETAAKEHATILKDKLAQAHFISGSAVVPNLESDEAWRTEAAKIRAQFEAQLNKEKTRLIGKA